MIPDRSRPLARLGGLLCIVAAVAGCPAASSPAPSSSSPPPASGNETTSSSEPPLDEAGSGSGALAAGRDAGPATPPVVDAGAPVAAASSPPPEEVLGPRVAAPPARPAMNDGARGQYRNGLSAAQQGDIGAARTAFEAALSSDGHAFQAAYNAGVIAERQGQDPQADSFYQRSLSIQPDYELALVARSRLLVRQRRTNEAVAMAADIARRFPGNFASRAEYARLLVLAQRYDDAINEGRQILRLDERNVGAKLAIAEAYRAQGRLDLSLYIVDDVINGPDPEHHPNNGPGTNDPRAHYLRGLLRIEVGRDVPGAIASFSRAVELDPQFAEAHNNLGVYLLQSGNTESAIQHLRAAVALSPSWAKAHLNLGDALRANRGFDEAVAELQRALQLDASLTEVHYNYGRLYSEQAREVASTGLDNLNRKLLLLQQATAAFTRFRDTLGPAYAADARHDDVEGQLGRLVQQVERTTRSRDRAARAGTRGSSSAAPGGAASPAPASPRPAGAASPAPAAPAAGGSQP
ncbi:MAG: tetratricopeptide repeat protein, partial [Deltaproteobacteria bacterium]